MPDRTEANPNELNQDDARYGFRCCHLKNIWTATLPPETELSRQMTTSTTSIDIMGLQAAYANLHTDQERDYFMQRYFFSSTRRHTRCLSDSSSDVCSSDLHSKDRSEDRERCAPLTGLGCDPSKAGVKKQKQQDGRDKPHVRSPPHRLCQTIYRRHGAVRSEERRVGKECRSRW